MMTPEEKFLFDLHGYLVIKNVLTPTEVAEMNAIADEKFPRPKEATGTRSGRVSRWGPPFQALIDHPKVLPYLVALIDAKFRLDHDYCIFMHEGDKGGNLHGGEGHEGDHWYKYRDGVMRNGLCVVTYFLTPAAEGDGGFALHPGHPQEQLPPGHPARRARFERPAPYVVQPPVEAGDALIFTEALVHGTMTWRARHERARCSTSSAPVTRPGPKYPDPGEYEWEPDRAAAAHPSRRPRWAAGSDVIQAEA